MTLTLLVVALGSYLALAGAFFVATRGAPKLARWMGLAAIASAAPFFIWWGAFAEQFTAGQCYSHVIESVATSVENSRTPSELAREIRSLPMRGYETNCTEVEQAAEHLSSRNAP